MFFLFWLTSVICLSNLHVKLSRYTCMIMMIWILMKMIINKHARLFGSSYIGRLYLWVDTQKHFDSLTLIIVICEWVVTVYWLISSNTEARTEDLYLQLDYQKSAYETMLYAVCYILFLLKCTAEHCSVECLNCQNSSRAYVGEMWLWPWHYSNNNVVILTKMLSLAATEFVILTTPVSVLSNKRPKGFNSLGAYIWWMFLNTAL